MLWGEYNYDEDIAAQRQEAFDDGITQGSQQAKIETAISMLKDNVNIDTIIKYTELPRNTVEDLIAK